MKGAALEKAAIALVPAFALATVASGLHVGASARSVGARVYAASPGGGRDGLALQLVTLAEEGGVPEVIRVPALSVVATAGADEARWSGGSNADGVVEAWLDLPRVHPRDTVTLTVTRADGVPLAAGRLEIPGPPPAPSAGAELRATRRSGELLLDVFLYGGTLVPGASTAALVRVRDGRSHAPLDGLALTAEPEPGLTVEGSLPPTARTASEGWSVAHVTAGFLSAAWTVTATSPDGTRTGTWSGALPVSPGAATADLPPVLSPDTPHPVALTVPPATPRLYVEVIDPAGRDFGASLDLSRDQAGHVTVTLPPLAAGPDYWLVTSSEMQSSGAPSGTTLARPFRVSASAEPTDAALVDLVTRTPPSMALSMVLDGLTAPRKEAARARRRGLGIAFGALAVATVLETLLVLRAASRSRQRMRAVSEAALDAGLDALEGPGGETRAGLRVAVLVAVTLLGLGFVALFLIDWTGK